MSIVKTLYAIGQSGDVEVVALGDVRTKNGRTPLHTACLHGHLDVVRFLLGDLPIGKQSHRMLEQRDSCNLTPFMDAILGDHVNVVEYLYEHYQV